MCERDADLLQAERGHPQGDARCKLGEEHVEGVEDGFMAFGEGVGESEVIHHIWQHRPGSHTHTVRTDECLNFFFCVSLKFIITPDKATF